MRALELDIELRGPRGLDEDEIDDEGYDLEEEDDYDDDLDEDDDDFEDDDFFEDDDEEF